MSTRTTRKRVPAAQQKTVVATTTVTKTVNAKDPPATAKGSRRRRRNRRSNNNNRGGDRSVPAFLLKEFARAVANPFEHSPPPLRFGTFCPTDVKTAILKQSLVTNGTDGSFGVIAMPQVKNALYQNINGAASKVWGAYDASSASTYASYYANARPIALGVRVFVAGALTTTPGRIYVGSISGYTPQTLIDATNGFTINALAAIPSGQMFVAANPVVMATWRPAQPKDMDMVPQVISSTGYATTDILPGCIPYVIGLGFTVNTSVHVEYVFHFEGTPLITQTFMTESNDSADKTADPSWFKTFPSMEAFWDMARPIINDNKASLVSATSLLFSSILGLNSKASDSFSNLNGGRTLEEKSGGSYPPNVPPVVPEPSAPTVSGGTAGPSGVRPFNFRHVTLPRDYFFSVHTTEPVASNTSLTGVRYHLQYHLHSPSELQSSTSAHYVPEERREQWRQASLSLSDLVNDPLLDPADVAEFRRNYEAELRLLNRDGL